MKLKIKQGNSVLSYTDDSVRDSQIGNLASLNTATKTNLVSAINEVYNKHFFIYESASLFSINNLNGSWVNVTFSGSALTRIPCAFLCISGQLSLIEIIPISFMGNGGYEESIGTADVMIPDEVKTKYGLTVNGVTIKIPGSFGGSWGYGYILKTEAFSKDLKYTISYSVN